MNPAGETDISVVATWIVTGVGFGLWLYGWFGRIDAIRKRRFSDAGTVLVFAAILARVVIEGGPRGGFDWFLVVLAPVFIGLGLWRLSHTPVDPRGRR